MRAKSAFVARTATTWPITAWLTTSVPGSGCEYMFSTGGRTTASRGSSAGAHPARKRPRIAPPITLNWLSGITGGNDSTGAGAGQPAPLAGGFDLLQGHVPMRIEDLEAPLFFLLVGLLVGKEPAGEGFLIAGRAQGRPVGEGDHHQECPVAPPVHVESGAVEVHGPRAAPPPCVGRGE